MAPHETGTTGAVETDEMAGVINVVVTDTTEIIGMVNVGMASMTDVTGGSDMASGAASVTGVAGGSDMASGVVDVIGVTGGSGMASGAAEVTDAIRGFRHLHLGSYSALIPPGARGLMALLGVKAATPGLTVSYGPNIHPALIDDSVTTRVAMEAIVACTDMVKVSDEDSEFFYPGVATDQIATQWLVVGPQLLIATWGGAGAQSYSGAGTPPESGMNPGTGSGAAPESLRDVGKSGSVVSTNPGMSQSAVPTLTVMPSPVTVADTIGVEDSSMAGLLAALAERRALSAGRATLATLNAGDLQVCLDFAMDAATVAVIHAGPYALTRVEIHQRHTR